MRISTNFLSVKSGEGTYQSWNVITVHRWEVLLQVPAPIYTLTPLQWRHNDHDSVSNHQPYGCLLNRLFRRRSKKTSKLRVTGFCVWNSPETGKFPAQRASNAENFPFDGVIMIPLSADVLIHNSARALFLSLYAKWYHLPILLHMNIPSICDWK